jgi:hypothetical protein
VARRVVQDGKDTPDEATLRRQVAVEAQYAGIGVAGALREMDRLSRNGVQQVAREAERTLEHARDGGGDREQGQMAEKVAALVAGLARELGRGEGGGGDGDAAPASPQRRRRRGQGHERER